MINMFCPKCCAFNEDRNSWCIRCGYNLSGEKEKTVGNPLEGICVEPEKEKKIKDYFVWSIIATVLGSVAFGIAALIFSGLTQAEVAGGNREKAEKYSSKAKLFCFISLGILAVKIVAVIMFFIFAIALSLYGPLYIF